jgi:hypothetical protein
VHLHQKYEVEPQVEPFNGMRPDLTRARPKAANAELARMNHPYMAMSHTNYAYLYWFMTTIRADLKNHAKLIN